MNILKCLHRQISVASPVFQGPTMNGDRCATHIPGSEMFYYTNGFIHLSLFVEEQTDDGAQHSVSVLDRPI